VSDQHTPKKRMIAIISNDFTSQILRAAKNNLQGNNAID
jgi:hypothetical protein